MTDLLESQNKGFKTSNACDDEWNKSRFDEGALNTSFILVIFQSHQQQKLVMEHRFCRFAKSSSSIIFYG